MTELPTANSQRPTAIRRIIFASGLGTMIEWYDFYIFGSLAVVMSELMFPKGDPQWALINYFPRDVKLQAVENLKRVGIAEKAFTRADQLSGGQQQRVGIARALMQEPRLILADEPVASLDPATSHSVLKHIEELNRQDGVTVMCALHFLSLARRYGTRVVALKAGRIAFTGMPHEIDEHRFKEIYGEEAVEVEIT